jgi:hypothetical protein
MLCARCGSEVSSECDCKGRKKIGLTGQTILAAIPTEITPLLAFYRIKKLKKGALIYAGIISATLGLNALLPFPYWMIASFSFGIPVPVYLVRKWTREFNRKI